MNEKAAMEEREAHEKISMADHAIQSVKYTLNKHNIQKQDAAKQ